MFKDREIAPIEEPSYLSIDYTRCEECGCELKGENLCATCCILVQLEDEEDTKDYGDIFNEPTITTFSRDSS